ncbi:hypothetical protein H2203_008207 [Taxawa tesnikishii (nom. ined.)]|nr:hypothetical protein H2203_008207 [Dothideales sp. JES 119]
MPLKQVYGKRSYVYSGQHTFFTSPTKPKMKPQVLEIDDVVGELGRFKIDSFPEDKSEKPVVKSRKALEERDDHKGEAKKDVEPVKKTEKPRRSVGNLEEAGNVQQISERFLAASPVVEASVPGTTSEDVENIPPQETKLKNKAKALPHRRRVAPSPLPPTPAPVPNIFTKHASSLLSLSSRPLTPFSDWADQLSIHFNITKIAEASFGEVSPFAPPLPPLAFLNRRVRPQDHPLQPPPATLTKRMTKAMKEKLKNMSAIEDVACEVRLMQRMTCIPGFTNFRDVCVMQGRPGESFVQAWRDWNVMREEKGKETSYFADPGLKASYPQDQLWAVIEMQDAGTDLDNIRVEDVWTLWDIFWGVALALGKGEEGARFEHRDLHMGNICVARKGGLENWDVSEVDPTMKLGFTSIETTIIDYTISRAQIGPIKGAGAVDESHPDFNDVLEEDVAFFDLEKDQSIFEGDGSSDYQYDLYRYMRSAMYLDDPLADLQSRWNEAEKTGRTWRGYHPQTNLIWMHFVLHQLMAQVELSSFCKPAGKDDAISKRAVELGKALQKVQDLLDPRNFPNSGLQSAGDLVLLAMEEGWLHVEDIVGAKKASIVRKTTVRRKKIKASAKPQ